MADDDDGGSASMDTSSYDSSDDDSPVEITKIVQKHNIRNTTPEHENFIEEAHQDIPDQLDVTTLPEGKNLLRWKQLCTSAKFVKATIFDPPFTENEPSKDMDKLFRKKHRDLHGDLVWGDGLSVDQSPTGKHLSIRVAVPECRLRVKREAFKAVIRNLADNAIGVDLPSTIAKEPKAIRDRFVQAVVHFFERITVPYTWLGFKQNYRIVTYIGAGILPRQKPLWTDKISIQKGPSHIRFRFPIIPPDAFGYRDSTVQRHKDDNRSEVKINPLLVRLDVDIPEPLDSIGFESNVEEQLRTTRCIGNSTVAQQVQALRLGKYISSRVITTFGTKHQHTALMNVLRVPYMYPDEHPAHQAHIVRRLVYGGTPLFDSTGHHNYNVVPSKYALENVPNIPTILTTDELKKRRVQGQILEVFRDTLSITQAWGAGCRLADLINIYDVEVLTRMCSCPDKEHCCDSCHNFVLCQLMNRPSGTTLSLCDECALTVAQATAASPDPSAGAHELVAAADPANPPDGSVLLHTQNLFSREARGIGLEEAQRKEQWIDLRNIIRAKRTMSVSPEGTSMATWHSDIDPTHDQTWPYVHAEGRSPFTPSVAAINPVIIRNGHGRGHVAGNVDVLPLYMNALQWIYPVLVLRVLWELGLPENEFGPASASRQMLMRRLEHLHLIQSQVPYKNEQRWEMRLEEADAAAFHEQMTTAIADQRLTENHVAKAWLIKGLYSKGTRAYKDPGNLENIDAVRTCIEQIRSLPGFQDWMLPMIGDAPYFFELGPVPPKYSMPWLYKWMALRLEVMRIACNVHWLTTVTVPGMIVLSCYQVVMRRLKQCPPHLRDIFDLPVGIYSKSCISASYGKVRHHERMVSGIMHEEDEFESLEDWDWNAANIVLEAWASNMSRSDFDGSRIDMQTHWRQAKGPSPYWPAALPELPPLDVFDPQSFTGTVHAMPLGRPFARDNDEDTSESTAQLHQASNRLLDVVEEFRVSRSQKLASQAVMAPPEEPVPLEAGGGLIPTPDVVKVIAPPIQVIPSNKLVMGRNMSNGQNWCYLTCPTQILGMIDIFRDEVLSKLTFPRSEQSSGVVRFILPFKEDKDVPSQIVQTRRNLHEANKRRLLIILYGALSSLFRDLQKPGPQLPSSRTAELKRAMAALKSEWSSEAFLDSAWFFYDLFELVFYALDESPITAQSASELYKESMEFHDRMDSKVKLEDQYDQFVKSQELTGFKSQLFQKFFTITAQEGKCEEYGCHSISRNINAMQAWLLSLPEPTYHEKQNEIYLPRPLIDLIKGEVNEPPFDAANRANCPFQSSHLGWTQKHHRLLSLPEILVFRISRPNRSDGYAYNTYNPVLTDTWLDMRPYAYQALPSDRDRDTEEVVNSFHRGRGVELETNYQLVALINLRPAGSHYVAYIDVNGINKAGETSQWVCYDDMTPAPKVITEDPTDILRRAYTPDNKGTNEIACLFLYRQRPKPAKAGEKHDTVHEPRKDDPKALKLTDAPVPPLAPLGKPPAAGGAIVVEPTKTNLPTTKDPKQIPVAPSLTKHGVATPKRPTPWNAGPGPKSFASPVKPPTKAKPTGSAAVSHPGSPSKISALSKEKLAPFGGGVAKPSVIPKPVGPILAPTPPPPLIMPPPTPPTLTIGDRLTTIENLQTALITRMQEMEKHVLRTEKDVNINGKNTMIIGENMDGFMTSVEARLQLMNRTINNMENNLMRQAHDAQRNAQAALRPAMTGMSTSLTGLAASAGDADFVSVAQLVGVLQPMMAGLQATLTELPAAISGVQGAAAAAGETAGTGGAMGGGGGGGGVTGGGEAETKDTQMSDDPPA